MFEEDGSLNVTYELYKVLEIRPPCTEEEIIRAYRKVALKYHPDKPNGSEEKFQQVKIAHDFLKDPIKRKYYDRFGDSGLKFLFSEEANASGFTDTSTFIGRFIINVITKPTKLIPVFLFFASLGIFLVLFLNFVDKKLYYSGLKTVPWYFIFGLVWIDILFVIVLFSFLLHIKLKRLKQISQMHFESDKYKNISTTNRRYLSYFLAVRTIVYELFLIIFLMTFIYCTFDLSVNLDNSGVLLNGKTWMKIFEPIIFLLVLLGATDFVLSVLTILKYNNPKRFWIQRSLVLANEAFDIIANINFTFYLLEWLDSSDRNNTKLLLIFSIPYVKILFDSLRIHVEYNWKVEDELERLLSETDEAELHEEIEAKVKSTRRIFRILLSVCVVFLISIVALINSHLAGYWPGSWSMTFSPILVFVFCSILVFGFCFPCIVTCMEFALPPNSFDSYFATAGEQFNQITVDCTVIEIQQGQKQKYKYGYGFAPIQPRIKQQ